MARIALSGRMIDVLVGPAGAGKTTAMNALRRAWEAEHGTGSVIGLAPSAVAAQALARPDSRVMALIGNGAQAEFQALADQILDAALTAKTDDVEALKSAPLGDGTVADAVQALSAKIGEKLEIRRVVSFDGPVATYLHKRSADLPPAVGVLVSFSGEGDAAAEAASR